MKPTKRGERARDIALVTVIVACAGFTAVSTWGGFRDWNAVSGPVESAPTHWIENSAPTLGQQDLNNLTGQYFPEAPCIRPDASACGLNAPDITLAPCGQSIPNTIPGECVLPDGTVITAPDTH